MNSKRVLKTAILLVLPLALIGLTGCGSIRSVVLHPIEKSDITKMQKGIPYTPEKDGYFLSDYYVEEVMRARINK